MMYLGDSKDSVNRKDIFMNGNERRQEILGILNKNPVSASSLAAKLGVSRQVIVSDIALLRASGHPVVSTPRGYVIDEGGRRKGVLKVITCRHLHEGLEDELFTIIDHGATVLDVIVEHSVYGQIQLNLNLSSRYDCEEFLKNLRESNAAPLAELTDGVHFHTILCPDEQCYERIVEDLRKQGIFIEEKIGLDKTASRE